VLVHNAVISAIKCGYRLFDCATVYGNEKEIGKALKLAISEKMVKRDELFIITKVFNDHHGKEKPLKSIRNSLECLQLDYVDMLLIHWPVRFLNEKMPDSLRTPEGLPNPELKIEEEYLDTWNTFMDIQAKGLTKSIGVSNFSISQLANLTKHSNVVPSMNQVEFHPFLFQSKLLDYCKSNAIQLAAYSPLGSPQSNRGQLQDAPSIFTDPLLQTLATKYQRSVAQIGIRWIIEKNVVCLPKSVTPERIKDNFTVFDFELSLEDHIKIDKLNRNYRFLLSYFNPSHFDN